MSDKARRRVTVPVRILTAAVVVWSSVLTNAVADDDPSPVQWPQVERPTTDTSGDPPVQQWPQPTKP